MVNRLPYETISGDLSAEITFKQLIEYLILIEEDTRKIANLCSARGDTTSSERWNAIANNFDKVATVVTHLAKGKTSSSIGYTGNATRNRS